MKTKVTKISTPNIDLLKNRTQLERTVALNIIALVSTRIQQDGEDSNNKKITSKSKNKIGAYSEVHAKERQAKGNQINQIDLTFTGDMLKPVSGFWFDFNVNFFYTTVNVGFVNEIESQKAIKNEKLFGKLFDLTKDEAKEIEEIINSFKYE